MSNARSVHASWMDPNGMVMETKSNSNTGTQIVRLRPFGSARTKTPAQHADPFSKYVHPASAPPHFRPKFAFGMRRVGRATRLLSVHRDPTWRPPNNRPSSN